MPNILIDEKAKDYILKKGGIITIVRNKIGNCWASVLMPEVRFGEPEIKNRYNFYEVGSIKVYVLKDLEARGDVVEIKLSSLLGILKNIDVYGFKVL